MKKVDLRARVEDSLSESAYVKLLLVQKCVPQVEAIARAVIRALKGGKRVVVFGNGGSAADAQHIAAEMEGRFKPAHHTILVKTLPKCLILSFRRETNLCSTCGKLRGV